MRLPDPRRSQSARPALATRSLRWEVEILGAINIKAPTLRARTPGRAPRDSDRPTNTPMVLAASTGRPISNAIQDTAAILSTERTRTAADHAVGAPSSEASGMETLDSASAPKPPTMINATQGVSTTDNNTPPQDTVPKCHPTNGAVQTEAASAAASGRANQLGHATRMRALSTGARETASPSTPAKES